MRPQALLVCGKLAMRQPQTSRTRESGDNGREHMMDSAHFFIGVHYHQPEHEVFVQILKIFREYVAPGLYG